MVMGHRLDGQGMILSRGIFLYSTVSRLALGPSQCAIQCVLGAFSLGVKQLKQPRHEADHSPPSGAKVKELYLHSLIHLYNIVPN
jgi:hypothetical protein